jgi:hypothetical protein
MRSSFRTYAGVHFFPVAALRQWLVLSMLQKADELLCVFVITKNIKLLTKLIPYYEKIKVSKTNEA